MRNYYVKSVEELIQKCALAVAKYINIVLMKYVKNVFGINLFLLKL